MTGETLLEESGGAGSSTKGNPEAWAVESCHIKTKRRRKDGKQPRGVPDTSLRKKKG